MGVEAIGLVVLCVGVGSVVVLLTVLVHQLRVQERGEDRRHTERMKQWGELISSVATHGPRMMNVSIQEPHAKHDIAPGPELSAPPSSRTALSGPLVAQASAPDEVDQDADTQFFGGPLSQSKR